MKTSSILWMWVLLILLPLAAQAQVECDEYFQKALTHQKTMTVVSQKQAIALFDKARSCYASQASKEQCEKQIQACRNLIAQLAEGKSSGETRTAGEQKGEVKETLPTESDAKVTDAPIPTELDPVKLSVSCNYLRFKGKGGEFKKAKVMCNYADWQVTEMPEWVSCSKNDQNELVIEVQKNPLKEERSGPLTIECRGESFTMTIIQDKPKKLSFNLKEIM